MTTLKYVFVGIFCFAHLNGFGQDPSTDSHYELVWSDEFSGTQLDSDKWTAYDWRDHGSTTGNMSSFIRPSVSLARNVEVSDGTLKLHLKRETVSCSDNSFNAEWNYAIDNLSSPYYCNWQQATGIPYFYTSAEIRSNINNDYTTGYGYFEARCRMSTAYGVWNSFWTFRDFGEAGNAGEIDIYETLGSLNEHPNSPNTSLLKTNVHLAYCSNSGGGWSQGGTGEPTDCNYYGTGDLCTGIPSYDVNVCANSPITNWHVYGLELTPEKIIWYIDGVVVRSMPNVGVTTKLWVELGIVAQAGYVTDYPNLDEIHEVDYFRFYEINQNDCDEVINHCYFSFPYYNNTVKKSITIGGVSCVNTQPSDSYYTLRAADFILINGDFEVPLGSELYLDVNSCY